MDREQFEHAIRAASAVLNEDELVVIGSQSIQGVLETHMPPARGGFATRASGRRVAAWSGDRTRRRAWAGG